MGLMRTLLFVPATRPTMIERARTLRPDAIILDLEDSVPLGEKQAARDRVHEALPSLVATGRSLWVRTNSTYTGWAKDDVRAAVSTALTGILLPKADSPEIVRYLDALLRDAERAAGIEPGTVQIIAIIESAAALLHAEAISRASARLVALAFGAEDFAADMQIERTPTGEEIDYARRGVAVVARAAGLLALDTVYPFLHDLDALTLDTMAARQAGFQGKLLIHPEQIEPVERVFTPSEGQVAAARRQLEAYGKAIKDGLGAIEVDGVMVDAPVAKRAQSIVDLAEAASRPS